MFIDTTGDANLAYLSGADYTIGREGKDVYGESLAPEHSDSCMRWEAPFCFRQNIQVKRQLSQA